MTSSLYGKHLPAGEVLHQDTSHIDDMNTLICNVRDKFSDLSAEWWDQRSPVLTLNQIRDAAYQAACDYVDKCSVELTDYECEVIITVAVAVAVATAWHL